MQPILDPAFWGLGGGMSFLGAPLSSVFIQIGYVGHYEDKSLSLVGV